MLGRQTVRKDLAEKRTTLFQHTYHAVLPILLGDALSKPLARASPAHHLWDPKSGRLHLADGASNGGHTDRGHGDRWSDSYPGLCRKS